MQQQWSGTWVADRLGIRVRSLAPEPGAVADPDAVPEPQPRLEDLIGLAVRRNPRRVQLLVSQVLGKHVPTDPRTVRDAGLRLGRRVAGSVVGDAVVLGFAETATALGHLVADALDAPYLHSTRRHVDGVAPLGGFEEEHSHATSHLLLPADPEFLARGETLVLVDDELSTGRTALNTIRTLHALHPRERYVVASLVDLRSAADRARTAEVARELGTTITGVALAAGAVDVPADAAHRGAALVAELGSAPPARPAAAVRATAPAEVVRIRAPWPAGVAEGGRHGFWPHQPAFEEAVSASAAVLADALPDGPVHVLGTEELMYAPLRIAAVLAERRSDPVTYSSTTRSPVLAVDEPGYAVRTALAFDAHDRPADGPGPRFAYNLRAGAYAAIVVVVDEPADTPGLDGLLDRLAALTGRVVVLTLPAHVPSPRPPLPEPLRGPGFGSYPAADVGWLLTDLSAVELEAPTEEREEAIQAGRAHYAESLPVEYQPDAAYQALFAAALQDSADRMAYAVGLVTEQILALRGPGTVLASLARAGTPVGVLMRRWARAVHGLDLPHYALSIVRGRGIDEVALAYLAEHHDPAAVMFVDGWTGKGAITRELAASVEKANAALGDTLSSPFSADLAVLADPGSCVEIYGTREDYLIPSACLNSTVSGLVSRTVLNDALIGPGDFHGAKFYVALADADVSNLFVDTVAGRFAAVRSRVLADLPAHLAGDHRPTWDGWRVVEEVAAAYDIGEVNLVKPGVGETTRVLLRRVPWRILVNPDRSADLAHVRVLAEQRGVPLEEVPGLPYSCIGLIHPRFTRGAVRADGRGTGG